MIKNNSQKNEENNGERHLKYQVTVNKDLSVSYEEIN